VVRKTQPNEMNEGENGVLLNEGGEGGSWKGGTYIPFHKKGSGNTCQGGQYLEGNVQSFRTGEEASAATEKKEKTRFLPGKRERDGQSETKRVRRVFDWGREGPFYPVARTLFLGGEGRENVSETTKERGKEGLFKSHGRIISNSSDFDGGEEKKKVYYLFSTDLFRGEGREENNNDEEERGEGRRGYNQI